MILNNSNEDSTVELSWSDDINADIIKQSLLFEFNLRKQFLEKCEELDILTDEQVTIRGVPLIYDVENMLHILTTIMKF